MGEVGVGREMNWAYSSSIMAHYEMVGGSR